MSEQEAKSPAKTPTKEASASKNGKTENAESLTPNKKQSSATKKENSDKIIEPAKKY